MIYFNDIDDNQIQVLGTREENNYQNRLQKFVLKFKPHIKTYVFIIISVLNLVVVIIIFIFIARDNNVYNRTEVQYINSNEEYYLNESDAAEIGYFEIDNTPTVLNQKQIYDNIKNKDITYTEVVDTVVNDIPFKIYIPHNAVMSLHHGIIDLKDTTIVYVAQAADIRADNGNIVGDFILKGEQISRGIIKRGYCASINGQIFIGMGNGDGFLNETITQGGYMFRQYPLVHNGKWINNKPKGKSIRRSICQSKGQTFMVETISRESFSDFAQSLVDLGVDNAIYLVGSNTYGWAIDQDNIKHEFGNKEYYTDIQNIPQNINYIVWRKQ